MLRYLLIGLLLAGCTASDGPIIAKDITRDAVLLTTAKGGTYVVELKSLLVSVGEEAKYSNGTLYVGGVGYKARRDR